MDTDTETFYRHSLLISTHLNNPFVLSNKHFEQQYSHIYSARIKQLRPFIKEKIDKECLATSPSLVFCSRILEVQMNVKSVLIGTLYKEMPLKPSIFDEYAKEKAETVEEEESSLTAEEYEKIQTSKKRKNYCSPDDYLILEDESGRIVLASSEVLSVSELVSGIVIGIIGQQNSKGDFEISKVFFPGIPDQVPRKSINLALNLRYDYDPYICLISGLNMGKKPSLAYSLLTNFLYGTIGSDSEWKLSSQISRVIIAGNSIYSKEDLEKATDRTISKKVENFPLYQSLTNLDNFLSILSNTIEIDVMSGPSDPSNIQYPQQPMHKCLFPQSHKYSSFHLVSNPYYCSIGDTEIFGTSGQNIEDISRYSSLHDNIDIIKKTLEWRHIAPTAPDTLNCYPFQEQDPFVLNQCPHVYFVGNCHTFQTQTLPLSSSSFVTLISLPDFSLTSTIVLVNLNNMKVTPLSFNIPN